MNSQQKIENVESLRQDMSRATVALVADYRGLTAREFDSLRQTVRQIDGRCRVVKNRLTKRAIEGTDFASLDPLLEGPIAIMFGFEDPVALAKVAVKFAGENEALEIRGGVLDGTVLPATEIKALADLPPHDLLQGQLLALLQAPATQLVRLLSEPATRVVRLVQAISDRAGSGGGA